MFLANLMRNHFGIVKTKESTSSVKREFDFKPLAFCWKMWWIGTVCIRVEFVRFDLEIPSRAWLWVGRVPSFPDPLTRSVLRKMLKPPETREAFAMWLFFCKIAATPHDVSKQRNNVWCPGGHRAEALEKEAEEEVEVEVPRTVQGSNLSYRTIRYGMIQN